MRARRLLVALLSVGLGTGGLAVGSAGTAVAQSSGRTFRTMHLARTVNLSRLAARRASTAGPRTETPASLKSQSYVNRSLSPRGRTYSLSPYRSGSRIYGPRATVPTNSGVALTNTLAVEGINHFVNRYETDNGNDHFSEEPPDQGMCVGNHQVLELVNEAVQVYSVGTGASLLDLGEGVNAIDLNSFFDYPPARNRSGVGDPFPGPSTTDPSCIFDRQTGHFIAIDLAYAQDPGGGFPTGPNVIDIAVSETNDATGAWYIYRLDATDDGTNGTPNHHCGLDPGYPDDGVTNPTACLGDYPHIGADRYGVYITTNEYPWFTDGFHGAQVYAFPKAQLSALAASVDVVQFDTAGLDDGNPGFTLIPANSSAANQFDLEAGGTEWLLSSNAAVEVSGSGSSNQLLTWALTNTSALDGNLNVRLRHAVSAVHPYAIPPGQTQPASDNWPLGQCLNDANADGCETYLGFGSPSDPPEVQEQHFDASDTRIMTTWYENGILYGALDTAVRFLVPEGSRTNAGIEWFVLQPSLASGKVYPHLHRQGVLRTPENNVTYPAIAVNRFGQGAMGFTLSGDNHFPSTAYASVSPYGVGPIHVSQAGAGPVDGFTWYNAYLYNRPRWGDYGAAWVLGRTIIVANEWIAQTCDLSTFEDTGFVCPDENHPDGSRSALANWSTGITELSPS